MSNPPPVSRYPRQGVPLRHHVASAVRHWWMNLTVFETGMVILGSIIGVVMIHSFWKEALDGPFEFARAVLTFVGVFLKTLVVNTGALVEPLIAPMINVVMFAWLCLALALCFWLWGYFRRKLG